MKKINEELLRDQIELVNINFEKMNIFWFETIEIIQQIQENVL